MVMLMMMTTMVMMMVDEVSMNKPFQIVLFSYLSIKGRTRQVEERDGSIDRLFSTLLTTVSISTKEILQTGKRFSLITHKLSHSTFGCIIMMKIMIIM